MFQMRQLYHLMIILKLPSTRMNNDWLVYCKTLRLSTLWERCLEKGVFHRQENPFITQFKPYITVTDSNLQCVYDCIRCRSFIEYIFRERMKQSESRKEKKKKLQNCNFALRPNSQILPVVNSISTMPLQFFDLPQKKIRNEMTVEPHFRKKSQKSEVFWTNFGEKKNVFIRKKDSR